MGDTARSIGDPGETHHPGTVCAGGAITLEHIRVDHAHLQLRAHNYQQLGLVFLFYARLDMVLLVLCKKDELYDYKNIIQLPRESYLRVNRVRRFAAHPTLEAEHLHLE
jgi:hypothetical protein